MDTLHRHNYDLSSALSVLVPAGGPVLCRDEMEEWSASEAAMFEEALEKYGKDFNDIRQDFVSVSLTSDGICVVSVIFYSSGDLNNANSNPCRFPSAGRARFAWTMADSYTDDRTLTSEQVLVG